MRAIGEIFHPGELEAQKLFNQRTAWSERAIAAVDRMYKTELDNEMAGFINEQRFFFISTADATGNCDCSFRGSEPDEAGNTQPTVVVEDARSLVFPDFTGNRAYNTLGNLLVNPHIGILFIDFGSARRLRVNGGAEVIDRPQAYRDRWTTALRYVRVTVDQAFWNCPKRIPREP